MLAAAGAPAAGRARQGSREEASTCLQACSRLACFLSRPPLPVEYNPIVDGSTRGAGTRAQLKRHVKHPLPSSYTQQSSRPLVAPVVGRSRVTHSRQGKGNPLGGQQAENPSPAALARDAQGRAVGTPRERGPRDHTSFTPTRRGVA